MSGLECGADTAVLGLGGPGLAQKGPQGLDGGPCKGKSLEVGQGWRAGRGLGQEVRARPQKESGW